MLNTLSIAEKRYRAGTRLQPHAHADSTLIVTVRGAFVEQAGAERRTISAGTVMIRAAGEFHDDEFTNDTVCLAVALPASFSEENVTRTVVKSGSRFSVLTARLAEETARRDVLSNIAARGITFQLLAEVLRSADPAGARAMRESGRLRAQILSDCAEPPSVAAIAASAGVDPVRLSRMFKRAYGCTPTEMVRHERVARAAALIREGRCSLTEIAACCGFYDQSHFSNVFRRVMGMTPRQYARQAL
jgi:AraC family transcriptional regulator